MTSCVMKFGVENSVFPESVTQCVAGVMRHKPQVERVFPESCTHF